MTVWLYEVETKSGARRCRIIHTISVILLFQASSINGAFQPKTSVQPVNSPNEPGLFSTKHRQPDTIKFSSPLLDEGYPPVIEEYENGILDQKPLLVYLPGFDGTWMAPFIQMPELSTTFDVRCLTMTMDDRSLYDDLKQSVVDFIYHETQERSKDDQKDISSDLPARRTILSILRKKPKTRPRSVYIVGESFGGILASDVALTLLEDQELGDRFKGLTLINSATCYDRSKLSSVGPKVASYTSSFSYNIGLVQELLPLLGDEYSWPQLLLILKSKALPSVIDSTERESFMGRVAFSIFQKLKYMPQETLKWRLEEWLAYGCNLMRPRLELFKQYDSFPTLIIAGEKDVCLPSIEEAERLSSIFVNSQAIVVRDAGHASTCGSRIDLAAEMRNRFLGKRKGIGRTAMKEDAAQGEGAQYGMEPRYDGRDDVGLSPIKYWSRKNYRKKKK